MRVALDLSSVVTGGGVTYARQMVPRLASTAGLAIGPVLVREALSSVFLDYDMQLIVGTSRFAARSREWKKAVECSKSPVVFAPTEISFTGYRNSQLVLALRNGALVGRVHAERPPLERVRIGVQRGLAGASRGCASAYVAVSQFASEALGKALRIPPDRRHIVYHGGPQRQAPPRGVRPARRFLFVSNLYRYKGLHDIIRVLAVTPGDWQLDVVGAAVDGRYFRWLRNEVGAAGIADRVGFHGYQSAERMSGFYREADCFVWSATAETFGHPLLEAYSWGLPVIAVEAGSSREIMGCAAYYYGLGDLANLGSLISKAIREGLAPGELPRTYSWDECAMETARLLRNVVRGSV